MVLKTTLTSQEQQQLAAYQAEKAAAFGGDYQKYLESLRPPTSPYDAALESLQRSGAGDMSYEQDQLLQYYTTGAGKAAMDKYYANNPDWFTPDGQRVYKTQEQLNAISALAATGNNQVQPLTQAQLDAAAANGLDTTNLPTTLGSFADNTATNGSGTTPTGATNQTPTTNTADPTSNTGTTATPVGTQASAITNPQLPEGATVTPVQQTVQPNEVMQGTMLQGQAPTATPQTVQAPTAQNAATYQAALNGTNVPQATAAQGTVSQDSQMQASQIDPNTGQMTAVTGQTPGAVQAAQIDPNTGQAVAAQGQLSQQAFAQAAQGIEDANKVAMLDAYQQEVGNMAVDPRATVREQFAQLMDFEAGDTPAWAQGALRTANAAMAARGLTNSTIAANSMFTSIVQAAMPIAQQDAQVFQTMQLKQMDQKQATVFLRAGQLAELNKQNLANRQQAAIQNAQAALTIDMANLDNEQQTAIFNAQAALQAATTNSGYQQQAAIETARNALSMNLANLSAENQAAIQNAQSALTVQTQNLNARQQAAQYNANAFLQMDMANLSAEQQTAIINAQGRLQALMSDTAAQNASLQFNAASENQVNQFFAQLANSTAIFNSSQALTADQFNAEMSNQRDQFNAKLATEIEQSNVIYQRQINTQYTADQNQANLINAQNLLNISNQAIADSLTLMRDDAHYAFTSAENAADRATKLAQQKMINDTNILLFDKEAAFKDAEGTGSVIGGLIGSFGNALIEDAFNGGGFLGIGGSSSTGAQAGYYTDGGG